MYCNFQYGEASMCCQKWTKRLWKYGWKSLFYVFLIQIGDKIIDLDDGSVLDMVSNQ